MVQRRLYPDVKTKNRILQRRSRKNKKPYHAKRMAMKKQREAIEALYARKTFLRHIAGGAHLGAWQSTFVEAPGDLTHVLTSLLTLCHPDRWSRGQLATELAHEISLTINRLREELR